MNVKVYGRTKRPTEAIKLLEDMKLRQISPHEPTILKLVSVCARNQLTAVRLLASCMHHAFICMFLIHVQEAEKFFDMMPHPHGLYYDAVLVIVEMYIRMGQSPKALKLLMTAPGTHDCKQRLRRSIQAAEHLMSVLWQNYSSTLLQRRWVLQV